MLQTAEQVAKRYNIPRQRMDEIRRGDQQKATAREGARPLRRGNDPVTTLAGVADAQLGPAHEGSHHQRRRRASGRERPTTASRTSSRRFPGGVISAGNASQFSDGAGAVRGR
jgi:acetyl-CoA C-acetyltransferase